MDTSFQIQSLKLQIENIKVLINNIEIQNNNALILNIPIGEQLLNLGIQMITSGIQAFNIGKNSTQIINKEKFYGQLKVISEQINNLINEQNEYQMMLMQQQMMYQQQQMMYQQQMNEQQQMPKEEFNFKNIVFENPRHPGSSVYDNITVKFGTKVKDVLNQYINKIYKYPKENIIFLFNSKKISRNEERTIEDFFNYDNQKIQVIEIDSVK